MLVKALKYISRHPSKFKILKRSVIFRKEEIKIPENMIEVIKIASRSHGWLIGQKQGRIRNNKNGMALMVIEKTYTATNYLLKYES